MSLDSESLQPKQKTTLAPRHNPIFPGYEIGVDEAGRGPMLGRVYTAAVILPLAFDHSLMKDSKKFHSVKKINAAAAYIKAHALHWRIEYADEQTIDQVNIRQATFQAMHRAIRGVMQEAKGTPEAKCKGTPEAKGKGTPEAKGTQEAKGKGTPEAKGTQEAAGASASPMFHLLIDGCDFKPLTQVDLQENKVREVPHTCIEGGDNLFSAIAAASILAKVARDAYVADLCVAEPSLIERYDLLQNKGYGTKKHLAGIRAHGLSPYHRKTFGVCKEFA